MSCHENMVDTERLHRDNHAFAIILATVQAPEHDNHNHRSVKSGDQSTARPACILAIEDPSNLTANDEYQHATGTHLDHLMHQRLGSQQCPTSSAAIADAPCDSCDTGRALSARDLVCRDFRDALGSFATGVTVMTAVARDGRPLGVTISSFNSVSLEPPLIVWSLSTRSPRLAAFRSARHYAVNVLAAGQQAISDRFAAAEGGDPFDAVATYPGFAGVPLLAGCSAWFECANDRQHPGGDHLLFLGRVLRFARGEASEPLIFHGGGYRRLHGTRQA